VVVWNEWDTNFASAHAAKQGTMISIPLPASRMVWRIIGWTKDNMIPWMKRKAAKGTVHAQANE